MIFGNATQKLVIRHVFNVRNHYEKFKFSPWLNRIKIHYKTMEKSRSMKSGVAKSISTVLGVEKSMRIIHAYLQI